MLDIPDSLKDPDKLNLSASALVLLVGLAVHWLRQPQLFQNHKFTRQAFEFWILKWLLLVLTWGLHGFDHRFVLAANELSSVLGLGFVFAMWMGDSYCERDWISHLVFLFGLLLAWDFVAYQFVASDLVNRGRVWLFPSEMTTFVVIFGMGLVMLKRYHRSAVAFFVSSIVYIVLQLLAYPIVLTNQHDPTNQTLLTALAFGKLAYGFLFYRVIESKILTYDKLQFQMPKAAALRIPNPSSASNHGVSSQWNALVPLISVGLLVELVRIIVDQMWDILKNHRYLTWGVEALVVIALLGLLLRYPPQQHQT